MSPASSVPRIGCRGPENPRNTRANIPKPLGTMPLRTRQSPEVTVVARTLMRTSPSFTSGFGMSVISRTSGGPYLRQTTAFTWLEDLGQRAAEAGHHVLADLVEHLASAIAWPQNLNRQIGRHWDEVIRPLAEVETAGCGKRRVRAAHISAG